MPGDAPAIRLEAGEVARLVLVAAPGDEVDLRVVAIRPRHEAGQGGQLEAHEVLAGQEAHEIRGREDGLAVDELHREPP